MTGKIVNLSDRGFGFAQPSDDTSREGRHFFHAKHLSNVRFEALQVGDTLEFESVQGAKGLEARNVVLIGVPTEA